MRGIKLVEPAILHGEGGDHSAPNVIIIIIIIIQYLKNSIFYIQLGLSFSNWLFRTEYHNNK